MGAAEISTREYHPVTGFPPGTFVWWDDAREFWCLRCLEKHGMIETWEQIERFRAIEDYEHFDEYPVCAKCGDICDYISLTPEWERNELLRVIQEVFAAGFAGDRAKAALAKCAATYDRFRHYIEGGKR